MRYALGTKCEAIYGMCSRLPARRALVVLLSCVAFACSENADSTYARASGDRQGGAGAAKVGAPQSDADARILKDFNERIAAYMKLREREETGKAQPKETSAPEKIANTQQTLASRIRASRPHAKPGDIFTPEIRQLFRRSISPELKGRDAPETKEAIEEDAGAAPRRSVLKVNAPYPEGEPLPTVPPNILLRLPTVPEELEYRIVNKDLILRDVDANLIVDFIPNALR